MISTEGLASELSDLGKAIGLIDGSGNVDAGWFSDPLGKAASILSSPQREAFLRLLDALLPPVSGEGIPGDESWHPVLGDQSLGNVYLTVKNNGNVVLGVAGQIGSASGSSGITARLRAQLPLVSANSSVQAVAGTAQGPLKLQLAVQLPPLPIQLSGMVIEAAIAPPSVNVKVTLKGLALDGGPPQDIVLDPANVSSEASKLVVALLKQVLSQLAATVTPGTELDALVKHLTGLLGFDSDGVPTFPIAVLASNPAALQNWLRSLTQSAAMTKWLGHLAGLIGAGSLTVNGDGSQGNPWAVQVVPFNAQSGLSVIAWTASDGIRFGVQASFLPAGANPPFRVDAQAILASIPLNGTGSASVLPAASILFRAPGQGGAPLASSAQISVGSLQGGIQWDGSTLRPLLELDQVTLIGPPSASYDRIDLTNTDSVAAAASSLVRNAILAALGGGTGTHLAALAGLVQPAGDPGSPHLTDLSTLVSNPARAIANFHRSVLLDSTHNWSFLMTELAALLGINTPVSGTGTFNDPWRIALAPAGPLTLELATWNPQTNLAATQQLRLGLRASAASGPLQFFWLAELLAFDLPASGAGDVRLMGGQHLALIAAPLAPHGAVSNIRFGADSFRAQMDWQPGSSMSWAAEIDNFKLTVGSASVTANALRFPIPGGFDVTNPTATAAALGVAVPDLEKLLGLLLMKATLSWGGMPGFVLSGLLGVHGQLSGLSADWPILADPGAAGSLLSDPFSALRKWLAAISLNLSADGSPFLLQGLNWLQTFLSGALPSTPDIAISMPAPTGSGTYDDPWALPLTTNSPSVDLLAWLEPSGPPTNWATQLATLATSSATFDDLIGVAPHLGSFVSGAQDAASSAGPGLALGLANLANYFSKSDGVVPLVSQIPSGGTWTAGTPINAAHSLQPHDPSAISQILGQIDTWAGGAASPRVVLLLGPAFSDHTIWSDLLASPSLHGSTSPSANFNLRVPGVDPSAVNLNSVTAAVDYYTADLADNGTGDISSLTKQIGRIVSQLGQLRPGIPATLVAHSTAGVAARAYTAANPAQVRGLITLGTPHLGADLPFITDLPTGDLPTGNAVRFLQGLRPGMAAGSLRDAIDHVVQALDAYLPPPSVGMLPVLAPYPVGSFAGAASIDTGGKPALALGGTLSGNLLDFAKQAANTLAIQAAGAARPTPTHISSGVRTHAVLPVANPSDVRVDATLRMSLFRVSLASGAPPPPHSAQTFGVRISLSKPDDWLVGGPQSFAGAGNPLADVRVRWCEFGIDIETGSAPGQVSAKPFLNLYQAAYHGQTLSRVQITDSGAQALLGEVMHAISVPPPGANSQVAQLLNALNALGITTPDTKPPGIGIAADAFNAITTDAASFFSSRLANALSTTGGLLGFDGPSTGPWTFPLGTLPIQAVVTTSPWTLTIQTTGPGLAIASNASLSFSAGVTLPALTPKLNTTLQIGGFSLTYDGTAATLTAQAPPWLAPFQVFPLPSAGTITATLNDVVPRLLFSAAGGALLESLVGSGFTIPPLDGFFSNTGKSAQSSPGIGNSTGDGFDSSKINDILQAINHLAGFAASPGLTFPPGIQLTASGAGIDADPVTFHLATTAPIGGVLGVQLTAAIDKLRHVTPGGTLSLTVPLPGTWPSVTIAFGYTGSQVSLSVAPQGIPAIQILPSFSGLGSLRGAAEALLPQALDALVDALSNPGPAPGWLTAALSVANAMGLYDNAGHFAAHSTDLRALLDGDYLKLFDPSKRATVAASLKTFLDGLGVFPSALSVSGSTLQWQMSLPAPATGTVGVSFGWDTGPLAQISATGVKLGNGAIIADLSAGFSGGKLQCATDLGVNLATLGINLTPTFSVNFASTGGSNKFQVNFYPLATNPSTTGPLTVTLAPTPGVQSGAQTPVQLVETLLIPLAAQVVFSAAQSKLTTALWSGGPTLEDALVAAQIVKKGATPAQDTLQAPLPPITTIATGLAAALLPSSIAISSTLTLSLVHANSRTGIALKGKLDFPVGSYVLSALFGAPDSWAKDSPGANDGLALFLFDDTFQFKPALLVAGLGLGVTGADDAPLVNMDVFRLGGFNGYLFFDAELQGGLNVNSFGGGIELKSLGLPLGLATGGNVGGNNPVAASLLHSNSGSGSNPGDSHPVNPGVDVDAWFWSGPTGDGQFHIQFGGQTGTLWIGIHSGFGPIYIDQLGLNISNTQVALLIDGSVKVDGLTAQANELTVAIPYKSVTTPSGWSLDLKGLAIGFNSPGVTLAGALVKNDGPPVEYDGLLLIKISDLGFIAVGAYSTPTDPSGDTYTSLFVFAGVFIAIGIPPIIDISGLGLGVGYNREIIVPNDLNQIPSFLLVEALDRPDQIADDPMGALMNIRSQLPARRGSFWLAVGLRGTSFAIVNVTAILYVALDRGVEVGLIGVARMALPSDDTALVSVELALKIRFSSSEAMFSIQAQLTDNSYLLSRDCQLTGGFAYFIWFSQSQFLLTLGGYHPAFHKRPEFPDVPRLGYHWSFLGVVAIKGESYFALTNTCVMAGTRFDATYGPDWLFVWFHAYCDFLISWDPFYYDISIGVSVGATFRIHICFIGCVDIDITVSIGASLHVLGPPFHGEVTVDLAVASVTVPFGPNPNPQPQPIPWSTFVSNYLHSGTAGNEPVLTHVITGLQPPQPAGGQPSPGTQDQPWKMTPEFSFRTETRMPAMEFSFLTSALRRDEGQIGSLVFGHYGPLSSVFQLDIAPLLKDSAHHGITSEHVVLLDGRNAGASGGWSPVVPADNPQPPVSSKYTVDSTHFQLEPVISQFSEAPYHLLPHDGVPAAANTIPVLAGLKFTGIAILRHPSAPIPISSLYDYGLSRPLPFATWSVTLIGNLQILGTAADSLSQLAVSANTQALLNASNAMLSGGGFFANARTVAGLPPAGLPPMASRSLLRFRSSPSALLPLTTGWTMKPVGLSAPPTINRVSPVLPVMLQAPRLRAVLQSRPLPTVDSPPQLHTTVATIAAAKGAPRYSPPKLDTIPGAQLHFVRALNAPRPTALARSSRTLRSAQTGWPLGKAHQTQFSNAESAVAAGGIVLPAGATHIWDVPAGAKFSVQVQGTSAARVTFLSRAGYVLADQEMLAGSQPLALPDSVAIVAVTCLGNPPVSTSPTGAPLPVTPGLGAITFAAGSRNAIVGWQTGNLVPQVGSTSLLGRGCVIILAQPALTAKRRLPAAQAMVRLSEALVDQTGVETWLPITVSVVGLLLDVLDPSASQDGDLSIAVKGGTLSTPPVRVAGGNRKMLFYNVLSRDANATYISVSVGSRSGLRLSGIVGLSGSAQQWGIRLNGQVPEHWVGEGPLTPDGQVTVRIFGPASTPVPTTTQPGVPGQPSASGSSQPQPKTTPGGGS